MGSEHEPTPWEIGEVAKSKGTMDFVSLHHHSTFSYLDGFGTPEQHAERAAELGMKALALTDHGNVSAHVSLEKAADKFGIKPIFGCELYTGGVKDDDRTQRKNHLTVLAETPDGYRNLIKTVSLGWSEGYYYEPTVSGAMLREHAEGLIVLSGCTGSLLATSLAGGKNIAPEDASYRRAKQVALRFKKLLGDRYYLEVQAFPELEKTRGINQRLAEMSRETGIPLVATLDAHYTRPDEGKMQAILHNVRGGGRKTLEQLEQEWGYDVPLCPLSDADILTRLIGTGLTRAQADEAMGNAAEIGERCNVRLPKVENLTYPLPPEAESKEWLFRKIINSGWNFRGFNRLKGKEHQRYVDRVKYEMDLIRMKGFIDYFLVVSDLVTWAKDNHIPVGPARGSAAASLVCYLMRITEIDPMHFPTLLFERFIDINRFDLPDIDLDFDDEKRYMVRDYLSEKYGSDRVGNIGTFIKYKGKNSLDDIQRSVYRDEWECKEDVAKVKDLLIERSSGDLRASATIEDTAESFPVVKEIMEKWPELYKATKLEGNVRGMSVHAAGLVIANSPLTDACATYSRTDARGSTIEVVSLDKHDAEYLNVMKLDALGLKTMGMIRICLDLLGMSVHDLYAIPLDDEDTLKGFQDQDVVGIFQFDGVAMRSVNRGVIPSSFTEVCDINALARPGPLHSGATDTYMEVKHGREDPIHYHPIVDRVSKHTNYQIVYQEQILQIVRELGDFTWDEASRIRKIISKKRGEQEFNSMRSKFIAGAATHDMDRKDADRVFSMLATAGSYAFNAAHCVSYGMIAWWTMYLKIHHPTEFYAASLCKAAGDDKRQDELLRDADNHDIIVGNVSLAESEVSWSRSNSEERTILPGFSQIKGIGAKTAQTIVEYRDEHDLGPDDWQELLNIRGIGPSTLEKVNEFRSARDPFGVKILSEQVAAVKRAIAAGILAEYRDGTMGNLPMPTHTSDQVPYSRGPNVPVVWIGVVTYRNPKDIFEMHHSKTGEHLDPTTVKDPHLDQYVTLLGQDATETVSFVVDRWKYPYFKKDIWDMNVGRDLVLIKGFKRGFLNRRDVAVEDLWVIGVDEEEE